MRYLKFVDPNFKCTVVDPAGTTLDWLFSAESEEKLRGILKRGELKPNTIESYDFADWKRRAKEEARVAKKKKNKDYEYKSKLWTEIKQYLFFLTNDKCGYCETKVRVVSPGDVEHYRPKRTPLEDKDHPGYYWLAYDFENYVPCCTNCNSVRGKRSQFPLVAGSPRAKGPGGLASEKPLLINPFHEDPSLHIEFIGPEHPERFTDADDADRFGWLLGLTPQGIESVRVYNLNRRDLVRDRKLAFEAIEQRLGLAKLRPEVTQDILNSYNSGDLDYYIMTKALVTHWFDERELRQKAKIDEAIVALKAFQNEKKMLRI